MHALVIGGAGSLGYHATLKWFSRGHRLSPQTLPPLPTTGLCLGSAPILVQCLSAIQDGNLPAD